MSFESFYGGRQGASFIIVKQFDAINLTETTSKLKYLAVTSDGYYIYQNDNFIERTSDNFTNYAWKVTKLDGSEVNTKFSQESTIIVAHNLPNEEAEGMVQCFSQGGDTTNEVNYGEYVIIDTLIKNNPDNGKVYRRGINYQGNLGGAEYIGQIIGPQGELSELDMDTIATIRTKTGYKESEFGYSVSNGGLVPGKTDLGYNDTIKYAWVNVEDEFGYIQQILIGFTFPYLVEEFIGKQRSAYYQNGDVIPTGKSEGDLLEDDFELIERIDDEQHPFYRKWKINIPHGIKGDSQTNLEIYPTRARDGASIYNDTACTDLYGIATGQEEVSLYDVELDYFEIQVNIGTEEDPEYVIKYVKNILKDEDDKDILSRDGWKFRVRYKQWNYDEVEEPTPEFIDIGEYNIIEKIVLEADGTMTAYYTYRDTESNDEKLRWIDYNEEHPEDETGITIDGEGTVTVFFNTLEEDPDTPGQQRHQRQVHDKVITWINDVSLDLSNTSANGDFRITYNNDAIYTGNVDDQGRSYYQEKIPLITDVKVETTKEISGDPWSEKEGSGSQNLLIQFNNDTYNAVGDPINYILDTKIVKASEVGVVPQTGYNDLIHHMIVLYSDPNRRAESSISSLVFHSDRLNIDTDGWTDLGDAGEIQGINICAQPTTIPADSVTPENYMGSADYKGWMMLVDGNLYTYDYKYSKWVNNGPLTTASATPNLYITNVDSSTLKNDGFYLPVSSISTVH